MKILLNRKTFKSEVIDPISKIHTDIVTLRCSANKITVSVKGENALLFVSYNTVCDYEGEITLASINILKKLVSVVNSEFLTIYVENNALRVDMGEVEYKVYMVSAHNKAIDMDKISRHAFSHNFVITAERWTEIKKYFSLLDKAAKLYFTTSDEKVLVTGTDKNKSLQDSLCVPLGVRGNFNEYIIINVFDILSVEKGDITFDFSANLCKISTGTKTYIVSCLHK